MAEQDDVAAEALAEAEALVDVIEPDEEFTDAEIDDILSIDADDVVEFGSSEEFLASFEDESSGDELVLATEDDLAALEGEQPTQQLTPEQAQKMAAMILKQVDDDDTIIPNFPLNLDNLIVWALENTTVNGEPAVIITFASPTFPRGIPFVLERDRGLKFCSQLKKRLQTGPDLAQGAPESALLLPPGGGGKLIVPGQG